MLFLHAVLKDNTADDDRDGCRELADEAECACGRGDVAAGDGGLESNERGLEIGSNSDTSNDSVSSVSHLVQGKERQRKR